MNTNQYRRSRTTLLKMASHERRQGSKYGRRICDFYRKQLKITQRMMVEIRKGYSHG